MSHRNARSRPGGAPRGRRRCPRVGLLARLLAGRDARRPAEGRRREPLDRQRRPAHARTAHHARLRLRGAVPLVGGARGGGRPDRRQRQRGQGLSRGPGRQGDHALRRTGTGDPRPGGSPERRGLRGGVSRRPDLPRGCQGRGDDVLQARRRSTSGRSPSTRTGTCSPAPARRARSTRSRPTARARFSTRPDRRTSSASGSTRAGTCWRAPSRRAVSSASTARGRPSSCSSRDSAKSTRSA